MLVMPNGKSLPADVYDVTRNADTERPFTGKYWNTDEKGTYYAACGINCSDLVLNFLSNCG
jgi:peptide methionine sulfoxide reductase MsrB